MTVPLGYGDVEDGKAPTFAQTLDFSQRAERAGLDSIWVFDHLIFRFPNEPDEGLHEAWTTLSALAPVVPRVELGALVMCSSFRNAGLMAKMGQTLDDLSGGRLILGLGCGWHEPEYDAFGFPFDHLVGRFEEDLEVVGGCSTARRSTSTGAGATTTARSCCPPPQRQTADPRRVEGRADAPAHGAVGGRLEHRLVRRGRRPGPAADGRPGRGLRRGRRGPAGRSAARSASALFEPGERGDDARSTDADAAGLADIFDELEAIGLRRRDHLVARQVAGGHRPDRRGAEAPRRTKP